MHLVEERETIGSSSSLEDVIASIGQSIGKLATQVSATVNQQDTRSQRRALGRYDPGSPGFCPEHAHSQRILNLMYD